MIDNDYECMKPLMYRDILSPENTPMGAPLGGIYGGGMYGGGLYNTNLLGGITMQPGLTGDKFQSYQQRQNKDFSFFKKSMLLLGGLGVIGLLRFRTIPKLFGKSSKIGKFFNKLFGGKSKAIPTPPPPKKGNWFTNLFSKLKFKKSKP